MKKVWIEPGCITCGACEFVAPEIFSVTDSCHIKDNAPITEQIEEIKIAAQACPVSVIKYTE